jgi:hypothetical protein
MPVVRELINRISFKVNPADKKNAEDTISNLEKGSKRAITNIKGIGKALAASLLAASVASTKMFVDFEKDTGAAAFFARNRKEAEELNSLLDQVAEKSETTSRREARRAAKTLSQTRLTQKQLRDFIPLLEKISVARPDLDFTAVVESFKDVITGGDLEKLIELVPGFKDTAEKLSKTKFKSPFGDITDIQRGEILLDALVESQPKLEKLIEKQRETLNFQFSALAKESSDFALKFGKNIAPAVRDSLVLLKELIQELNKSESFWKTVESTVKSIQSVLQSIKEFSFSDEFKKSNEKAEKIRQERSDFIKSNVDAVIQSGLKLTEDIDNSIKALIGVFTRDRKPGTPEKTVPPLIQGIQEKPIIEENFNKLNRESKVKQKETAEQSININLSGSLRVENESGVEISKMTTDLTSKIMNELRSSLNNITASNGGFVGV